MTGEEVVPAAAVAPPVSAPPAPQVPAAAVEATKPAIPGADRLKAFADIPLQLTIEIGWFQVMLKDIKGLKPGKIFRIAKAAGEPFDICANGQPVARGEVIVVENSSGVRITEVIKL